MITIPDPHPAQRHVLENRKRYNVVACGRRWGKTDLGVSLCLSKAVKGEPVGWFAPTYKLLEEAWDRFTDVLRPAQGFVTAHKADRVLRIGSGRVDFWTLETTSAGMTTPGRGRKYARVAIDEAAMARQLGEDWNKSIRPTLTDLRGDAFFFSTPFGQNDFYQLWMRGEQGEENWASFRMPTVTNPYIAKEEIDEAERSIPADAFQQEYLAEFLADAANPFGIEAIDRCVQGENPDNRAVVWWGVDLAKSVDWTVAIGFEQGGNVVAFQRWQSDWRNTRLRLRNMIGGLPALIDSTGVGDPIVEDLMATCPNAQGYNFTSASKQRIMEGLAYSIQNREITFPDGPIVRELKSFQYEYKPSGVRYSAPEGLHDDCVCALALAVECKRSAPSAASMSLVSYGEDFDDQYWNDPMSNEAMWTQT